MKWYPKTRPWLIASMCLLMCGCDWCPGPDDGDGETTPTTYEFTISGECKATDKDGAEITELELVAGQTVIYCNNWSAQAEVKFSIAGFLPGDVLNMTLEPGACITHVVGTVADGNYAWELNCQDHPGRGGGPVKVDNPPPGGP